MASSQDKRGLDMAHNRSSPLAFGTQLRRLLVGVSPMKTNHTEALARVIDEILDHNLPIHALAQAILASPVMDAIRQPHWLPIDSAPKDGTNILVACRDTPEAGIAYWSRRGWLDIEDDEGWCEGFGPTHWMPLPAAPKGAV